MYDVRWTNQFKKDIRKCQKQGKNIEIFKQVSACLVTGESLETKYKDHQLIGQWKYHRECHLAPDWLMIYRKDDDEMTIDFIRMGSHAELFS